MIPTQSNLAASAEGSSYEFFKNKKQFMSVQNQLNFTPTALLQNLEMVDYRL